MLPRNRFEVRSSKRFSPSYRNVPPPLPVRAEAGAAGADQVAAQGVAGGVVRARRRAAEQLAEDAAVRRAAAQVGRCRLSYSVLTENLQVADAGVVVEVDPTARAAGPFRPLMAPASSVYEPLTK